MKKIKSFLAALMMLASVPAGQAFSLTASAEENYNGYYAIRNVNSGLYLGMDKNSSTSPVNVIQADDVNVWKLEADTDGYYQILFADLNEALTLDTSGNNIYADVPANSDNQLFNLSANADGSFKLIIKATENAVEVINAETDAGANVQQWEVNGANCQDWELIPVAYTEKSAEETKVKVSGDEFIAGDLNDDGIVNIYDLILSKKLLLSGTATEHQQHAGNVSGDKEFSVADIIELNRFLHHDPKASLVKQPVDSERRYAAVDGIFTDAFVETTNAGFTESAYLNLYNEIGTSASWNISAPADNVYAVTVRYANGGTADRAVKVTLNNQVVYWTLEGKTTGAWTNWEEETLYLPLSKGMNTLKFTSLTADGASNIDYISITDTKETASPSQPIDPIKGKPIGGRNQKGVGIQMEYLNRGVVAANTGKGMLVSWRKLATDSEKTSFKLYKNGEFVAQINAREATNYYVDGGLPTDTFTIDTFVGTKMTEFANTAIMFGTKNSGQSGAYFDIPTQKPADQTMPDGSTCTYTENDCSVGDIDGDGQYEIFVKWDPSNSQDNSKNGYTGTVFIDCYRLDGTLVWRVDLGKNIRAGAHYTQFMVYDFDGDGKCEMICKTADGTKDGAGNYVGDASKDYRSSAGRILDGPEYITLFDGATGKALDTQNYDPARGNVGDWGDTYGNRVDRFTACVAYLDGEHASAVFGRGYYTRSVVAAWDVKNGKLSKRWTYDTGYNASTPGYGDGNHHIMAADVDSDGKQEVVVGSAVVDDNGKLLYTTGNAHGDAIHIGDFDLSNPGLEIFQCLEDEKHPNGKNIGFGVELRDAKTGKALFRETAGGDTGRCICDNLVAGNAGAEMHGSHSGNVYEAFGNHQVVIQWADITKWGQNSLVYWTDVLERAVLDRTMADQYGKGRVFTGDGVAYNNGTKSNACLTCDLLGDWREEMIFRKSDGGLRVFTTTFSSEYPVYSLMHNAQYRVQVASQNNGYNQPPHTDYFLGTGYDLPEVPTVYDYKAE